MAWLYKRSDSEKWWIGWRVNGRQFLKSTGTVDKAQATKKLREQEFMLQAKIDGRLTEQFYQALTGKTFPSVTLAAAMKDWLIEAKATTAHKTSVKYHQIGADFLQFTRATDAGPLLRDVSTEDVRSFLTDQRTRSGAPTVNLYRKILSGFFIRGVKNGILQTNPVLPIKPFKAAKNEVSGRRAFSLTEIQLLYGKAPSDFWRYMILGGFYTGLRLGDLATMVWGSVDLAANVIRLKTIKTGDSVTIPVARPLRTILEDLRGASKATKPTDAIWPKQAKLYWKKGAGPLSNNFYAEVLVPAGMATSRGHHAKTDGSARAAGVSFHCLRHTFVTFLKITGSSNAVAKELAGHSSDAMSDHYTDMPIETLATAVAQLPEVTK